MPSEAATVASRWRKFWRYKWWLAALLIIGAVVCVYRQQNHAGRAHWELVKRRLETRGEKLDWNSYVPPEVPDSQNAFSAPNMSSWFIRGGSGHLSWMLNGKTSGGLLPSVGSIQIAAVTLLTNVSQFENLQYADAVLLYEPPTFRLCHREELNPLRVLRTSRTAVKPDAGNSGAGLDPDAQRMMEKLLLGAFSQLKDTTNTVRLAGSQGYTFAKARPTNDFVRFVILSDEAVGFDRIKTLFSGFSDRHPNTLPLNTQRLDSNTCSVSIISVPFYSAAEYLDWSGQCKNEFDTIREALKRPSARMPGNYQNPASQPVPDFVVLRVLAQTLAQRAQCFLLLDDPENALKELALLNDLSRLLNGRDGKPVPLVAAMIGVALKRIYVTVVHDGIRTGVWREPQLVELQRQLAQVHLIQGVSYSLRAERAGVCQIISDEQIARSVMLARGARKPGLWGKLSDPHWWLLSYGSEGLLFENAATLAEASQKTLDGVNAGEEVIHPQLVDQAARTLTRTFSHFSLKSYLAGSMLPNCGKALKTTAYTQALVNEAYVACALERYRLKNGSYPDRLDKLLPAFAAALPHDPINGQPLCYKLGEDARYLLYSVGWNEIDDGGTAPPSKTWEVPTDRPMDWVWPGTE